jgi:hypothetical protein
MARQSPTGDSPATDADVQHTEKTEKSQNISVIAGSFAASLTLAPATLLHSA